jgi:hypothetical protein
MHFKHDFIKGCKELNSYCMRHNGLVRYYWMTRFHNVRLCLKRLDSVLGYLRDALNLLFLSTGVALPAAAQTSNHVLAKVVVGGTWK